MALLFGGCWGAGKMTGPARHLCTPSQVQEPWGQSHPLCSGCHPPLQPHSPYTHAKSCTLMASLGWGETIAYLKIFLHIYANVVLPRDDEGIRF